MLVSVFEDVRQRVARDMSGDASRILVRLVISLADGEASNLAELETLPHPDQGLALALFEYCLSQGLSEEERCEISETFAPFAEMYSAGERH